MTGVIGVIANESARYTMFYQCLLGLERPPGAYVNLKVGSERAISREAIVRAAIADRAEWIWFVDDDHTFRPSALLDLLSHDVPIVSGLIIQRGAPFLPTCYSHRDAIGWFPLDLERCPEHGLVQVEAVGTGGLLVKTRVFEEMGEPWFQYTAEMSEDMFFCTRAREMGIRLAVDLDVVLGHIAPAVAFPIFDEGRWMAGLSFGPSATAKFPIVMPKG